MSVSVQPVQVISVNQHEALAEDIRADLLATEEPLAIWLGYGPIEGRQQRQLSITMRTPGHDIELVLGYLFSEGIIHHHRDVVSVRHCTAVKQPSERENAVRVELAPELIIDWKRLQRYSYTSSSCGVCGKTSIEALNTVCSSLSPRGFVVHPDAIHTAPNYLREAQLVFKHTGGLHAAGLFDQAGNLLLWQEDVGRHNALDKLIGAAIAQERLPLDQSFVLLSGRISFELVQKALVAGVPLLAAVGAPSSLAVQLANTYGMTLLGFVRDQRFNIYTGRQRIAQHTLSEPSNATAFS